MATIKWNATGERYYETGIEKAVLFIENSSPVVWDGLISVSHTPVGGETEAYYFEGNKYLNTTSRQEYKATINAYSSPREFNACNGIQELYRGLEVTSQNNKSFNLVYKTLIGNDESSTMDYKLHLIYNAKTQVALSSSQTLTKEKNLSINKWTITAVPPLVDGYLASAYRVIDTRKYSSEIITNLENALYGTDITDPYFPTPAQLTTILGG